MNMSTRSPNPTPRQNRGQTRMDQDGDGDNDEHFSGSGYGLAAGPTSHLASTYPQGVQNCEQQPSSSIYLPRATANSTRPSIGNSDVSASYSAPFWTDYAVRLIYGALKDRHTLMDDLRDVDRKIAELVKQRTKIMAEVRRLEVLEQLFTEDTWQRLRDANAILDDLGDGDAAAAAAAEVLANGHFPSSASTKPSSSSAIEGIRISSSSVQFGNAGAQQGQNMPASSPFHATIAPTSSSQSVVVPIRTSSQNANPLTQHSRFSLSSSTSPSVPTQNTSVVTVSTHAQNAIPSAPLGNAFFSQNQSSQSTQQSQNPYFGKDAQASSSQTSHTSQTFVSPSAQPPPLSLPLPPPPPPPPYNLPKSPHQTLKHTKKITVAQNEEVEEEKNDSVPKSFLSHSIYANSAAGEPYEDIRPTRKRNFARSYREDDSDASEDHADHEHIFDYSSDSDTHPRSRGRGRPRGRGRGRVGRPRSIGGIRGETGLLERNAPIFGRGRTRGIRGTRGRGRVLLVGTHDGRTYASEEDFDDGSYAHNHNHAIHHHNHHHGSSSSASFARHEHGNEAEGFSPHMEQTTFDEDLVGNLTATQESAASSAAFGEGEGDADENGGHHHVSANGLERHSGSASSANSKRRVFRNVVAPAGMDPLSQFVFEKKNNKTNVEFRDRVASTWNDKVHGVFLTKLDSLMRYIEHSDGQPVLREQIIIPTDEEIQKIPHAHEFESDLAAVHNRLQKGNFSPEELHKIAHIQSSAAKVGRKPLCIVCNYNIDSVRVFSYHAPDNLPIHFGCAWFLLRNLP